MTLSPLVISTPSLSPSAKPVEDSETVLIVDYENSKVSQLFADSLASGLVTPSQRFRVTRTTQDKTDLTTPASIAIAVGKEALMFLLSTNFDGFVLTSLIDPVSFNAIMQSHQNKTQKTSAIFHEAPVLRQILLFKEISPAGKRVGMLFTPEESYRIDALKNLALKLNLIFEYEVVEDEEELTYHLIKLIKRSDAIIATKNSTIYNRSTIKSILLTLYRHNKFLIGADLSFIRAGSIATTHTTMQQLIDEVINDVGFFIKYKQLPESHFSGQFNVKFNEQVARSLNLTVRDESHYTDIIQAAEINFGDGEVNE